ncbi:MAG: DNA gyrase inhibitor YacG [Myxococcota bacterium]
MSDAQKSRGPRKCPTCRASFLAVTDERTLPFCSSRCKLADLGAWLGDEYRLSSEEPLTEEALIALEAALAQTDPHR